MATITEDYVSFETAKLLKEKGFDEPCAWLYDNQGRKEYVSAYHLPWPNSELEEDEWSCCTLQMAMKWLREVHNRFIEICTDRAHNFKYIVFRPAIYDKELDCLWESDNFSTYEQACEAAIKYCLENLI